MHPDTPAKIAKAEEFLEVADVALMGKCYDAAVSLSASAAVNGSDALCLEILGDYPSGNSHEYSLTLLRKCGIIGDNISKHLRSALKVKTKAQYSAKRCRETEAQEAYRHAERIISLTRTWVDQKNQ